MPRALFTPIQLPPEQPDKCSRCPLLGLRPKGELTKGQRQAYCCLGVFTPDGFSPLTSKRIGFLQRNDPNYGAKADAYLKNLEEQAKMEDIIYPDDDPTT